jgi:epoxyqueuosine reductase QueG
MVITISRSIQKEKEKRTVEIHDYFTDLLKQINHEGIFGIARFSSVFNDLMPIQKLKLEQLLKEHLTDYMNTGSILSIGIFYPPDIIDCINVEKKGKIDKTLWNHYSNEYQHLNCMLKQISKQIAEKFNGIAIPPTTETPAEKVKHVKDYYQHTISHRLVAEHAGLGWRGKNELLITKERGPAVRFTSIIIDLPLIQGCKLENKCGNCTACLDVCPFLKNKENLEDYRENCRKYIILLGLSHDVCGKCIKACFRESLYKEQFQSHIK